MPASFGITDVALDPLNPTAVYASAFDNGAWRRSALDGSATPYDFRQVFAPQFPGGGTDRTMFALTVKNGQTRIYLTDGTANGGGTAARRGELLADGQRQPACGGAARLAGGRAPPSPRRRRRPVPGDVQRLAEADVERRRRARTSRRTTSAPASAGTTRTSTRRPGMPDTVYVIGSYPVRRAAVQHEGRRLRQRPLERPRGPLLDDRRRPRRRCDGTRQPHVHGSHLRRAEHAGAVVSRTRRTAASPPCRACGRRTGSIPTSTRSSINPGNPTQIFEGSDGGVIRTSGDVQRHLVAVRRQLATAAAAARRPASS